MLMERTLKSVQFRNLIKTNLYQACENINLHDSKQLLDKTLDILDSMVRFEVLFKYEDVVIDNEVYDRDLVIQVKEQGERLFVIYQSKINQAVSLHYDALNFIPDNSLDEVIEQQMVEHNFWRNISMQHSIAPKMNEIL
jgi:hypothetical protein